MPELDAPIVAVTVFSDRARVTRRGSIHLAPGEHTLVLGGLPATLEEDSVRASGKGANLRLLGVEVITRFVPRAPEADVAALRQQLESLQDADRALADDEATVAARTAFLKNLRERSGATLARTLASGKATLANVEALAAYLAGELDAIHARARDLARQRRPLAEEIGALGRRLAQGPQVDAHERREIHALVEAAAETDLELELLYAVTGASWTPHYDIRLVEDQVTVTYLASVRQQSGEDWPAVPLALSTARPAVSATLPELAPWYIDTYRPPVPLPRMAPFQAVLPASMAGGAPAPPLDAPAPEPPPAPPVEATMEGTGASVTYRVARLVAVPADGSPHRTTVTTLQLAAQLDYVTVPKLAEEAYLRAWIKNTSLFTLLPGAADIFHDADFVGTTRLKSVTPNESVEVQLGVDERVKVKRELTERAMARGLVGNLTRTLFAYKITLTNNLGVPAHVTVYDQLPVARHEEIKVRLQETSPRPAEQTGLNVLQWTFDIPPQEKREISFAFNLEHPRAMRVVGIDQ